LLAGQNATKAELLAAIRGKRGEPPAGGGGSSVGSDGDKPKLTFVTTVSTGDGGYKPALVFGGSEWQRFVGSVAYRSEEDAVCRAESVQAVIEHKIREAIR